jgi:hypothetical protein
VEEGRNGCEFFWCLPALSGNSLANFSASRRMSDVAPPKIGNLALGVTCFSPCSANALPRPVVLPQA